MTEMTAAERAALLKLIARNARVAAADVDSLAAERYADFERDATKLWTAQDLGVKELVEEINADMGPKLSEARRRVRERCDELGIDPEVRPRVAGGAEVYRPYLPRDRREERRRFAKAEIEANRKRAKVEIERRRAVIEARVLTSAISSDEGRAILGELPTADTLLPPVDVQAILSARVET